MLTLHLNIILVKPILNILLLQLRLRVVQLVRVHNLRLTLFAPVEYRRVVVRMDLVSRGLSLKRHILRIFPVLGWAKR